MLLLWRAVELLLCALLVVWTMIFPLATLLSLAVTLPLFALFSRPRAPVPAYRRARRFS